MFIKHGEWLSVFYTFVANSTVYMETLQGNVLQYMSGNTAHLLDIIKIAWNYFNKQHFPCILLS